MPCRDYESDCRTVVEYRDSPELKKKVDMLTRLMCKLCSDMEGTSKFQKVIESDKEIRNWWKDHQEEDRKEALRVKTIAEKKAKKEKALSKLSLEERKLLGL